MTDMKVLLVVIGMLCIAVLLMGLFPGFVATTQAPNWLKVRSVWLNDKLFPEGPLRKVDSGGNLLDRADQVIATSQEVGALLETVGEGAMEDPKGLLESSVGLMVLVGVASIGILLLVLVFSKKFRRKTWGNISALPSKVLTLRNVPLVFIIVLVLYVVYNQFDNENLWGTLWATTVAILVVTAAWYGYLSDTTDDFIKHLTSLLMPIGILVLVVAIVGALILPTSVLVSNPTLRANSVLSKIMDISLIAKELPEQGFRLTVAFLSVLMIVVKNRQRDEEGGGE